MLVPDLVRQRAKEIDFPTMYSQALAFLEQCSKVDEIKDFSDKVAAAAVYYKQKNDRRAFVYMRRLHINSAKSLGDLCRAMPAGLLSESDLRRNFASAKLSAFASAHSIEDGAEQMEKVESAFRDSDEGRLATIPIKERRNSIVISEMDADKFLAVVESDKPPTVSALASAARRSKRVALEYTAEEKKVHALLAMRKDFNYGIQQLHSISEEINPKKMTALLLRQFTVRRIHRPFDQYSDDIEEIVSIDAAAFHLDAIRRVSGWLSEIYRLLEKAADSQSIKKV